MSRRIPMTSLLIILCFIIGITIFLFKVFYAGFPITPNEKIESWHIESKLEIKNPQDNLKVRLEIPEETPFFATVEEDAFPDTFGQYQSGVTFHRNIKFSKKKPKKTEVIFFNTVIYKIKSASDAYNNYYNALEKRFSDYPLSEYFDNDDVRIVLDEIHNDILPLAADQGSYVKQLFEYLKKNGTKMTRLLTRKTGTKIDTITLATELLRYADIPARSMNGILLSRAKEHAEMQRWTEAYIEGEIIRFNVQRPQIGMPTNIFPWYEGEKKLFSVADNKVSVSSEISVKRHIESALTESFWSGKNFKSFFYNISVYNLPIETQLIMSMLLLIPVGAVVCVFLKQMVGIPTYGTFMPVLIAISFRETELLWGIIFFSSIIAIGMLFRSLFDNMRLLVVPRLTAVLTIVVGIIFVLSFSLNRFGYSASGLSLFPLIILTMLIERMSITWEEQGAKESMTLALNSMLVAVLCYFVISNTYIEHLFIGFPELLFVILSFSLALGRYTGFKLTEYFRFKALQS